MAFTSGQVIFATGGDTTESRALATATEILTGTASNKAASPDSIAALWEKGSDIASAGTISMGEGGFFHITGTTTITDIDPATDKAGRAFVLCFDGALTLTHNGTTLILPTSANITTEAGDCAWFVSEGSDAVRCVMYQRKDGEALVGGGGLTSDASDNTGGGTGALAALTTGGENTALGDTAGNDVTTGDQNTMVGAFAGERVTTGGENTCVGYFAGRGKTIGYGNTIIGSLAGNNLSNTDGDFNVFIGRGAGSFGMSDVSYTLCIDSDVTDEDALIYGEFNNRVLRINGEFYVKVAGNDSFLIDDDATAGNTRMLVWDVTAGTLQRVSIGANDSGGSGYRVLRIANSA
jgi:hypothetical protein